VALSAASSKAAVRADINVTPMIDVMLVLLIIFMIVTPAIMAGFTATVPRADNAQKAAEEPDEIRLGIDYKGQYFLDVGEGMRLITDENLPGRLAALYAARTKDKILYLKVDQDVQMARVQEAVEVARHAGVRVLGAIAEQKPLRPGH
jgi:biopolymer transport protein ExbD